MVAKLDYYDYGPVLSYNALYHLIAGARGLGKTYGITERAINGWFKKRDEFFLLRRYKDEIKKAAPVFFEAHAHLYPYADFRSVGGVAQVASAETRGMKKREWDTLGYFGALSQGQQYKGTAFPRVRRIIYDECILERGNAIYLRDEVVALNNFYSTIDRNKNTTKLFMLANAVEIANPFFIDWQIRPEEGREFNVFHRNDDGTVFGVCHLPGSESFQRQVRATKYGRFLEKTSPEYAEYAIGNVFHDATDERIAKKSPDSKYRFTLETRSQTISIWFDLNTRNFYAVKRRPKNERIFVIDRTKMGAGKTYIEYGSKIMSMLRTAWNHDRILFDEPNTRNLFLDIFKR